MVAGIRWWVADRPRTVTTIVSMFDVDDSGAWFEVNPVDGGEYVAVEGMTEDGATGAAIAIPLDMAPYLAAQLLEAWTFADSQGEEVRLDEDGWPHED